MHYKINSWITILCHYLINYSTIWKKKDFYRDHCSQYSCQKPSQCKYLKLLYYNVEEILLLHISTYFIINFCTKELSNHCLFYTRSAIMNVI